MQVLRIYDGCNTAVTFVVLGEITVNATHNALVSAWDRTSHTITLIIE